MELSHSDKKSINELYGIIKGIDADNIINQEEIKFLQEWLINNKNYENSESIGGIYNSLKKFKETIPAFLNLKRRRLIRMPARTVALCRPRRR